MSIDNSKMNRIKRLNPSWALAMLALGVVSDSAIAADTPNSSKNPVTLESLYYSNEPITLNQQEKTALAISERWKNGDQSAAKPLVGRDGAITFVYGVSQSSIVCAVMQVCDIELQPGERVNSVHLGDTARWSIEPAFTGNGPGSIQHVIVKPYDTGLDTTLIIATDRRTYNLALRSDDKDFMSRVNFIYPGEATLKFAAMKAQESAERTLNTLPETGEYLGNLDFEYDIDGDASWKPIRVYNDGKKTILEMPEAMQQTESPSLLVIREGQGWFSKDEDVLVNYRVQSDRYIVDSVFDKAMLIAGVGSSQTHVMITRKK